RSRTLELLTPPPEEARRHRSHVFDDEERLRPRLSALRMEVRRPERPLACRGRATWVFVRRHFSKRYGLQRPQPRHRLVLGHRKRVARPARGFCALARPRKLRRRRPSTQPTLRPHPRRPLTRRPRCAPVAT